MGPFLTLVWGDPFKEKRCEIEHRTFFWTVESYLIRFVLVEENQLDRWPVAPRLGVGL